MRCYIYCTKAKPSVKDYNGRIIAEFECNKIETFNVVLESKAKMVARLYEGKPNFEYENVKDCCIDAESLINYASGKTLNFIYIDKLKPINLTLQDVGIETPPQNMCHCKGGIVISIKPEWCEKIMSGEKKTEVRKRILKEMEELIVNA